MRPSIWISLAIAFFVILLLAKAPAWVLVDVIAKQQPNLLMGKASGTVWVGELETLQVQNITLSGLSWSLNPIGLFMGIPLHINVTGPIQGSADVGMNTTGILRLRDVEASGDLAAIMDIVDIPSMGFDGDLALNLQHAELNASSCLSMAGQFTVNSLVGDIDGVSDIAPVSAKLHCADNLVIAEVDENNTARVRGTVKAGFNGRVNGQITLSPERNSDLFKSLTQFMGRPRNNADFILRF
jgi:general secretion pathway protein N